MNADPTLNNSHLINQKDKGKKRKQEDKKKIRSPQFSGRARKINYPPIHAVEVASNKLKVAYLIFVAWTPHIQSGGLHDQSLSGFYKGC